MKLDKEYSILAHNNPEIIQLSKIEKKRMLHLVKKIEQSEKLFNREVLTVLFAYSLPICIAIELGFKDIVDQDFLFSFNIGCGFVSAGIGNLFANKHIKYKTNQRELELAQKFNMQKHKSGKYVYKRKHQK